MPDSKAHAAGAQSQRTGPEPRAERVDLSTPAGRELLVDLLFQMDLVAVDQMDKVPGACFYRPYIRGENDPAELGEQVEPDRLVAEGVVIVVAVSQENLVRMVVLPGAPLFTPQQRAWAQERVDCALARLLTCEAAGAGHAGTWDASAWGAHN